MVGLIATSPRKLVVQPGPVGTDRYSYKGCCRTVRQLRGAVDIGWIVVKVVAKLFLAAFYARKVNDLEAQFAALVLALERLADSSFQSSPLEC